MAVPFSQTLRSLDGDSHGRPALVLAIAMPALALWALWFFLARLPDYETSIEARIEREHPVLRISASAAGTVAVQQLVVGRRVHAGETLIELDSQREWARLREERAHLEGLRTRLQNEAEEIAAQKRLLDESQRVARLDVRQAELRLDAALLASGYSAERAARWRQLSDARLISREDLDQRTSEADGKRTDVEFSRVAVQRQRTDWQLKEREQQAALQRLKGGHLATEREIDASKAAISRLEYELQLRTLRSPIEGTVAETATLQVGSLVQQGENLGVIVPEGGLKISAYFTPAEALGRVRPGQPAKMQLLGFPAAQFGYLEASVSLVASEVRDGKIRVELSPSTDRLSGVVVEHGMPGTVQVEVAVLSPLKFVVRAAGKRMSEHAL